MVGVDFLRNYCGMQRILPLTRVGVLVQSGYTVLRSRKDFSRCARLRENPVHASRGLSTNGWELARLKYLTVRPELHRRAPIDFSHSLALEMTR